MIGMVLFFTVSTKTVFTTFFGTGLVLFLLSIIFFDKNTEAIIRNTPIAARINFLIECDEFIISSKVTFESNYSVKINLKYLT